MDTRDGRDSHGFVSREAVARFVLGAPRHIVTALGGIDAMGLRAALDAVEPEPAGRRALAARIAPGQTTEAIVEQAIAVFADTARLIWPIWFTDMSFPDRDDARPARRAEPPGLSVPLGDAGDPTRQDRRDEAADEDPAAMVRQAQERRRDPEGSDDQRGVRPRGHRRG